MSANMELEPINRILKLLRIADELSAGELGAQIDLSKSYISDIETGRKKPTLTVLEKYGQHFGISPANLLLLQEGNRYASNTELLFKVLEKRIAAVAAGQESAAAKTAAPLKVSTKKTSVDKKRTEQPPKTTEQKELAIAV